jgi:subtilisin family serine protease
MFSGVDIESVKDLTDVSAFLPSSATSNYSGRQILLIELASDDEAAMQNAIEILEGFSSVAYAAPNIIGSTSAISGNYSTTLWNMEQIEADLAWDITIGSHEILVGVLDSGVSYNHPSLADNTDESLGHNFLKENPFWWYDTADPIDDFGHGSHVAGIIGADGNNDEDVIGVNHDVTIVPLKIFDNSGNGSEAELISALVYAECLEIPILNLSGGWTGTGDFPAMRDAIEAYSGLLVAAAGNNGTDNDGPATAFYPSSFDCENIISVAASNQADELCDFSNYGALSVDLAAPGIDILSTVDYWLWDIERKDINEGWYTEPGYEAFSGTSAATAHVTGVAALLKSADPNLSTAEIKAAILDNVDADSALSGLVQTGGRLNAYAALNSLGDPLPTSIEIAIDGIYFHGNDDCDGVLLPSDGQNISTAQAYAIISPSNAIQDIVWESSNPLAAEIDQDGLITAGEEDGFTTITATTVNNLVAEFVLQVAWLDR